jgi:predicted metallo-beta-lactamase superfamily hydrolase
LGAEYDIFVKKFITMDMINTQSQINNVKEEIENLKSRAFDLFGKAAVEGSKINFHTRMATTLGAALVVMMRLVKEKFESCKKTRNTKFYSHRERMRETVKKISYDVKRAIGEQYQT